MLSFDELKRKGEKNADNRTYGPILIKNNMYENYKKAIKPEVAGGLSAIGIDKSPGLPARGETGRSLSFDELKRKGEKNADSRTYGPIPIKNNMYENHKKDIKPKAAGGLSAIGIDKSPGLLARGGTGRSYEEAAAEGHERAARLAANAALPERLMPKGDMSKLLFEERSGGTVNPVINPAAQRTNYDFMTDREAAVYRYYAENDREDEAKEYLKALEMDLNKRAAEKRMADTQELAEESTIGGLYARGVGNLIQGAGAAYALGMGLAGKDVDPYHPLLIGDQIRRGTTAGLLGESTGVGKFVKEAALNFFDFGTQAAALGPLTSINMALGAGASSTVNALERGGTTDEAVAYGMVSGIAEAITERIGYERLFKLARSAKDRGEVAKVLKKLLPNMASEAAEEATAEMVNLIADVLILDEKSQLKGIFEAEIAKGATEGEAMKAAIWEGARQVGYSGLLGAAGGGMIAGSVVGLNYATGKNVLRGDEGAVQEAAQPMETAEKGRAETEEEGAKESESRTRSYGDRFLYPEGQRLLAQEEAKRGDVSFLPAFQVYYTAGLTGVAEADIRQTAETAAADRALLTEAYLAGSNDRRADVEARLKGTGKMGQTQGVFLETEAVTEEQKAFAELISEAGGMEVVLVDSLEQDANGMYKRKKGQIYVAMNSDSFTGTLFHESAHYIREANPEGYDRMQKAVFEMAAKLEGVSVPDYMAKYEARYGESAQDIGDVLEEMTADAFQMLAKDEESLREFLREMQRSEPTVLEQIKEFLERLMETLQGLWKDSRFSSFAKDIHSNVENTSKLQKIFAEELHKAGELQREGDILPEGETADVAFSLKGVREDGIEVYETGEEVKKLSFSRRRELFKKRMEEEFKGRTAKFYKNGKAYYATFQAGDVNKNIYGDKKSDQAGMDAKLNTGADGSIFELVENARYISSKAEKGKKTKVHKGVTEWDYFLKRVQIDNAVFDLVINIRKTKYAEYVYSIQLNENKEITAVPPLVPAYNRKSEMATRKNGERPTVNDSIPQFGEKNNDRNITNEEKFSIRYTEDNTPFVEVEEDILAGVPKKDWVKRVKQNLKAKFPDGIRIEAENIRINAQTSSEITNSEYSKWIKRYSPKEYADKFRMTNNMDEILITSQNWKGEGLKHPRKDNIVEFARGTALIKIGKNGYKVDVVVGTTKNGGMVLYDIVNLERRNIMEKKQEQTAAGSESGRSDRRSAPVSDKSIAQESEKNNDRNITNEEKFSIRYTEDNTPFVEVEEDILAGVPKKDWVKRVKQNLKAKFPDGVEVGNNVIHINQDTRREMTYSKYMQKIYKKEPGIYADKMRATGYADEILKASTDYVGEGLNHPRKDDIKEFARGSVLLRIGQNDYRADVVVGTKKSGNMLLYDVLYLKPATIQERKKKTQLITNNAPKELLSRPSVSSENSIAQGENEVNNRDITNNAKFSLKEPVEETAELIAVHNISVQKLSDLLELGGFPMPSIAITKADTSHADFGEVSFLFRKESADPGDRRTEQVVDFDEVAAVVIPDDMDESLRERAEERFRVLEYEAGNEGDRLEKLGSVEDVKFSKRETFAEQVDAVLDEKQKFRNTHVYVRETPEVLTELGFRRLPMLMTAKHVYTIASETGKYDDVNYHGLGKDLIKEIPEAIEEPIVMMRSATREDSLVMVLGLANKRNKPIIASVKMDGRGNYKEIEVDSNIITSVYGKDGFKRFIQSAMDENRILYFDKEKSRAFAKTPGVQFPDNLYKADFTDNVAQFQQYVKMHQALKGLSEDVKFSKRETFAEQVDAVLDEKRSFEYSHVYVMETPEVLTEVGLRRLPMLMTAKHVYTTARKSGKYKNAHYHDLGGEALKMLPEALQEPVAVMRSATKTEDSLVMVTELRDKENRPVIAAVHMDGEGLKEGILIETNLISSVYGRTGFTAFMQKALNEGRMLYFDKEKSRTMTEIPGVQFPDGLYKADFTDNIAQFQQYVKMHQALKGLSEDVRFSLREEEIHQLEKENGRLQEANRALRRQLTLTKEAAHDPVSAKKAVKKWLKEYQSEYDAEVFTQKYLEIINYIANAQDRVDMPGVMAALQILAEDAISESRVLNTELRDSYMDLIQKLRSTTIHAGESMRGELRYWGGYNAIRKANFGRVALSSKGGIHIDSLYQELAETYPEFFNEERVNTQGEMLMDMLSVLDILRPEAENPYGYDLKEYALDGAYQLWEMFFDIAMEKPTYADKQKKAREKAQAKYKQEMRLLREEAKKEKENALRQQKEMLEERSKTRRERERERNQRAWARAKEENREKIRRKQEETYQRTRAHYEARLERKTAGYKKTKERQEYARYRRYVEKDVKALLKWMEKPTDQYHIDDRMLEGTKALLEKIQTSDPDIEIKIRDIVRLRRDVEKIRTEADGGEGVFVETDESVMEILKAFEDAFGEGIRLADLTAAQMRYLSNVIRSLKTTITNANKMLSLENGKKISELAEGYIQSAGEQKAVRQSGTIRQISDFFNLDMLDPKSFFQGMGDKALILYEGLRKGFDRKVLHVQEAIRFMNSLIAEKTIRQWRNTPPQKFSVTGGDIYLTIPQVMGLYCTMRRRHGKIALRMGGMIAEPTAKGRKAAQAYLETYGAVQPTEGDINAILSTLTAEQRGVAERMQAFFQITAKWGNETSVKMFGYSKFMDSSYYPVVRDANYVNVVYGAEKSESHTLRNMGSTKPANQFAKNAVVIEDIFTVFARQVDQMSSYNAYVPALSDLNKFLNYKKMPGQEGVARAISVRDSMNRIMGSKGLQYVKALMERINGVANREGSGEAPARLFVRNMKVAAVGANLSVIIQQPTAYIRAADMIDSKYLLKALMEGRNDYDKIYQNAPIAQWKEWGFYETNIGKSMESLLVGGNYFDRITDLSMLAAGKADKLTWGRLWKACELETRDKQPTLTGDRFYEEVGRRLSEIIDGTQVVDSILHRSQIMRSKSVFTQMATSFMSEPTKTYNILRNSIVEAYKSNTPESRRKLTRCIMVLAVAGIANSAVKSVIGMLRDDDEDEKLLEKWMQAFSGDYSEAETVDEYIMAALASNLGNSFNPMNYIPYIRDLFSIVQGYEVQRTDFAWAADVMRMAQKWNKFNAGESEYTLNHMLLETASSLSKLTGLPIHNLKRDLFAVKDTVINQFMGLDTQYDNKRIAYDIGAEKNASMYVKMMLEANMNGDRALATRIYNEMVKAGIDNKTLEDKMKSQEVKNIKADSLALKAVTAYGEGDYSGYTEALTQLREKGYKQKNTESAIRSMYKERYPEEKEERFESIAHDFWDEEEMENGDFDSVLTGMLAAKWSGDEKEATRLYNYMIKEGLSNEKIDGRVKSLEVARIKEEPAATRAAEAYAKGDYDAYSNAIEGLMKKNYFRSNVESAVRSLYEKAHGEEEEESFQNITEEYWNERTEVAGGDYEMMFNAFMYGSTDDYRTMWQMLRIGGKKESDIKTGMKSRLKRVYREAVQARDYKTAERARKEFLRLGGRLETLAKE